jgi:hypothetical protein
MGTSHWRPSVGDRVRVQDGVAAMRDCAEPPHYPAESGRPATVRAEKARPGAPGHPFLVVFDRPSPVVALRGLSIPLATRHYAAEELEPLDG